MFFAGSLKEQKIIIVAGETPDSMKYFEKLLEINSEQVTALRLLIRENTTKQMEKEEKDKIFNEISHLNNDLINAKRELAQKNAQLTRLNEKLENLVIEDDLTGLYNRRFFFRKATEEIAKAKRLGYNLTLVMLDINNFKTINDTYGHDAGDKILCDFAKLSKKTLREIDFVFRIGGDEFLFLLTDCDKEKAEKIVERVNAIFIEQAGLSLAYGVEKINIKENIDLDDYIKITDQKMYIHKKISKGQ
jgi:diguanylate cyclase (GGDEF)-like protein